MNKPKPAGILRNPSSPAIGPASFRDKLRLSGAAFAYLFAFFSLLGITPATVALVLLTLAFLFDWRAWKLLWQEPVVKIALLFGGYVLVHSASVYLLGDDDARSAAVIAAGADWLKLLLFIPFAYWAGAAPSRAGRLLFAALAGFAIGFLRKIDWAAFDAAFFTTRFENYLPAIAFGMFCGLAVLGLIAARSAFWSGQGPLPRWLMLILWALLLALMAEGLFLSFSRGSWLAFGIGLVLLLLLEWRARRHSRDPVEPASLVSRLSAVLALAGLAALVATQSGPVIERTLLEAPTILQILQGDWSDVESNSAGVRAHALGFAAELWSQRPLFGWGAGSSGALVAASGRSELVMDTGELMPHLHNSYAEVLVQFGAVGFLLMGALVLLLVLTTARECRAGRMPAALCRYLLVSLVFVLIWNLFNYRIIRHDGLFFWMIFAGVAYSSRLRALAEGTVRRR